MSFSVLPYRKLDRKNPSFLRFGSELSETLKTASKKQLKFFL